MLPCTDIFIMQGMPEDRAEVLQWWHRARGWLCSFGVDSTSLYDNGSILLALQISRKRPPSAPFDRHALIVRSPDELAPGRLSKLMALAPFQCVLGVLDSLGTEYERLRRTVRARAMHRNWPRVRFAVSAQIGVDVSWQTSAARLVEREYRDSMWTVLGHLRAWGLVRLREAGEAMGDDGVAPTLDRWITARAAALTVEFESMAAWWRAYTESVASEASVVAGKRAMALGIIALGIALLQFAEIHDFVAHLLRAGVAALASLVRH